MQENANLDVFNFSIDDIETPSATGKSQIFKPNPKKGKAGVYDAVIRFIPWHKNVKDSIVKKAFFWLEDPNTKQGFYADCPTNVGQKSILWDLYWKFYNSDSVIEKAKAEKFKRKEEYYSIVQIVKDDNNPDNVGKLMIYKYPFKVHQKLEAEKKPKFGDPKNPFDLFTGRDFGISVKIVSGWNNYDDCGFIDGSAGPIKIDGRTMTASPEDKAKIMEYLQSSPDLESCKHQAWTTEVENKVMDIVRFYTSSNYQAPTQQAQAASAPQMQAATPPVTESVAAPQVTASAPITQPIAESAPVAQASAPVNTQPPASDDPLASLYANL